VVPVGEAIDECQECRDDCRHPSFSADEGASDAQPNKDLRTRPARRTQPQSKADCAGVWSVNRTSRFPI
jgi:hypothetical protein